ncbi:hypothetical protein HDU98_007033 [Podochytrium sp. JEL0797]|nr:hypothetical protein HDU98_007033 [Podochytrium sp. JEL0797]
MKTLTVAVLVCDTPADSVQRVSGGDYFFMFSALLSSAASALGVSREALRFVAFDSVSGAAPFDFSGIDALLVTGAKHGVNDGAAWIATAEDCLRRAKDTNRVKIIGVCFGHQLVAKAFGGKVERNSNPLGFKPVRNPDGWEVGWTQMNLTQAGKLFFGAAAKDTVSFYSMHKDVVTVCPAGFSVLFSTDLCPIQSLVQGKSILTIQSHPEFTADIVREIVKMRRENGVFAGDFADEVVEILVKNPSSDSMWFSEQIIKFLFEL